MWTPQIEAKDVIDGFTHVLVSFTGDKDERPFNRTFVLQSIKQLKQAVQSEVDRVTTMQTEAASLVIGPFDTTTEVSPPSPGEIARAKYFKDLAVLNKMREAIAAGIRKETDQDYIDQLALVKSEFNRDYELGANLVAVVERLK